MKFFSPPEGGNDIERIRARLLSRVLNVYMAAALTISAFLPGNRSEIAAVSKVVLLQAGLCLLMRGLMHAGRLRAASWIFLLSLAVSVPLVSVFITGTVAAVSVSVFQMLVIVMAGLVLGGSEALVFAALMIVGNGALFWYESLRLPDRWFPLQSALIVQATFYTATAALLSKAIRLSEEALGLASREATDRRAAETALRDNMERYRLITSVSSDYVFSNIFESDGRLRLDWAAGAFETITGFALDEFVERGGWAAALHPDDRERDRDDVEILRQNKPVTSELRIVRKDGQPRWVRVYAHPVWDAGAGRLVGIYGAVQDINARKLAELEREELIGELEARNAELERFTYTVSHDLKSPLITIRGFLGHIEQAAVEGRMDEMKADMERVYRSTSKMHQLLDDLLDLSRIGRQAKSAESVALDSIVLDALDRTHGRLTEVKASVEVEGNLGTVLVDRERVVEVLQNLIDNAAKFMGDQAEPHIWIGARDVGPGRAFFVRDNGAGIPARHHERVFNLFDKLDPRSAGTGVGLALVRRIIEVHGGRVWVESEGEGRGATFLFTLGSA